MSQNLQNFVKFQKIQLENLVDFEKCCKTHIFLQKSEPIQPKTINILPKFSNRRSLTSPTRSAVGCRVRGSCGRTWSGAARCGSPRSDGTPIHLTFFKNAFFENAFFENAFFENAFFENLQIFGGLVLGCIKTKFCKKICVRQHFSSSTRFASFCTAAISKFLQKIGLKNQQFS